MRKLLLRLHYKTARKAKFSWDSAWRYAFVVGKLFRALDLDWRGRIKKNVPFEGYDRFLYQAFEEALVSQLGDLSRLYSFEHLNLLEGKPVVLATFHYGGFCLALPAISRRQSLAIVAEDPENLPFQEMRDFYSWKYERMRKLGIEVVWRTSAAFKTRQLLSSGVSIGYVVDLACGCPWEVEVFGESWKLCGSFKQLGEALGIETVGFFSCLSRKGFDLRLFPSECIGKEIERALNRNPSNWIASDLVGFLRSSL